MKELEALLNSIKEQGLAVVLVVLAVLGTGWLIRTLLKKIDSKDTHIENLHKEAVELQKTTTEALVNVKNTVDNNTKATLENNRMLEKVFTVLTVKSE